MCSGLFGSRAGLADSDALRVCFAWSAGSSLVGSGVFGGVGLVGTGIGAGVGLVGTGIGAGVGLVGSGIGAVGSGLGKAGKLMGRTVTESFSMHRKRDQQQVMVLDACTTRGIHRRLCAGDIGRAEHMPGLHGGLQAGTEGSGSQAWPLAPECTCQRAWARPLPRASVVPCP